MRQILHVDAGVGGDFFAKLKSVTSVCYINPCRMFPLHPVMSAAPNEIKALVEMGHPPTSCVCVERTPRVGAVSVDIRVLCACVYMSCQVVAALHACACEGACVLECGLTFNF